jgi:hypothetical protein
LATAGWLAASRAPLASAQTPAKPVGEMKALGGERYQIGAIVIDKRARKFTVPGRVHLRDKPLEYLATTVGGMQAYGSEFNLACILIGLERDPKLDLVTRSQSSIPGQRIAISIAWSEGGKRRQVSAAEAILSLEVGVAPRDVGWVYIGAPTSDGNPQFAADMTGTLIGFIHDPNCVVESVQPIGLGAYGSVRGSAILPPVGTAIEMIVEAAPAAR